MSTTGSLEHPERFHKYTVTSILPDAQVLVTDRRLRVLTILDEQACMPVAQEQLTTDETLVFEAILAHLPYYCPYENLYSCFYNKSIEEARDTLQEVSGTPAWDAAMRPVRNTLSRVRLKTRPLGIDVRSMIDTGYMLIPAGRGIRS